MNRRTMMVSGFVVAGLVGGLLALLQTQSAVGMANFARRYGADCSMCHTTVPQLNTTGYNFRRAGYRMPDEIGAEVKEDLTNLYAMRGRARYAYAERDTGRKYNAHSQFTFGEATFYPLAGAFLKNWSSLFELTFTGEDAPSVEVENAYGRFTYGNKDRFLTVRAGVMHPFEGFGAADRPIGNYRPLFETSLAKHSGVGSAYPIWGTDQLQMEVGGTWKGSTVSAAALNGYKNGTEGDTDERRDVLVFANQLIGETGGGVSGYYYKGSVDLAGNAGPYKDDYNRMALFANFPVFKLITKSPYLEGINLLAGYEKGTDKYDTLPAGNLVLQDFGSSGYFGEVQWPMFKHLTWIGRYDKFDPDDKVDHNEATALTTSLSFPFENIKFLVDAQQKTTKRPYPSGTAAPADFKDLKAQAEFLFIF